MEPICQKALRQFADYVEIYPWTQLMNRPKNLTGSNAVPIAV
jgi:hypothetical protein